MSPALFRSGGDRLMAYAAKADKSHDTRNSNDTLDQGHPKKDSKLHLLLRLGSNKMAGRRLIH